MPYNNLISRTDAAALIPEEASLEIIQNLPQQSAVMGFARRLPNMSRGQLRLPVMSALANAYFVDGDTGLKQTSEVNWENKYVYAEELACIVPIPEAVLDDAEYDIWAEVRPSIEEAMGKAIDQAVLYGTNIPAQWTTSLGAAGIFAVATAAGHVASIAGFIDIYAAIMGESAAGLADGLLMLIEADGYMATGHIAHTSMKGKLRNLRDSDGNPIFKTNTMQEATGYALDGEPLVFPLNGAMIAASALQFCGDWSRLVWSVRQEITYKILDQAVLQDGAGNIIYNLAQQDMVALRAVMRLGFALPNPPTRENETAATRCAFSVMTA